LWSDLDHPLLPAAYIRSMHDRRSPAASELTRLLHTTKCGGQVDRQAQAGEQGSGATPTPESNRSDCAYQDVRLRVEATRGPIRAGG
jgi:hypothetical protein